MDSTYKNVLYTRDELAKPFAEDFNLTEQDFKAMRYKKMEGYGDRLVSEMFQGIPEDANLTDKQLADLNAMLKSSLVNPYTNYSRQLGITHETRTMRREVKAHLDGKAEGLPKYRIYSAHDSNVANWLYQINPSLSFPGIKYAASIYFEVYHQPATDSYFVQTLYNAVALQLEACSACPFCAGPAFETQMQNQMYQGDLKAACAKDPTAEFRSYLSRNYLTSVSSLLQDDIKFLN